MGESFIRCDNGQCCRFMTVEEAAKLLYREYPTLRCQALTSKKTLCLHKFGLQKRKSILSLLQPITNVPVPSPELSRILVDSVSLALCGKNRHEGDERQKYVLHSWCERLRNKYKTMTGTTEDVECYAEWGQHAGSRCWVSNRTRTITRESPRVDMASTTKQPLKFEKEDNSDKALTRPRTVQGTETKASRGSVDSSRPKTTSSSNISSIGSERRNGTNTTEDIPILHTRRSTAFREHRDGGTQIQDPDPRPGGTLETPAKRQQRPILHRSDLQIVRSIKTDNSSGKPVVNDSPISLGKELSGSCYESESSPSSAYSVQSSVFDYTPSDSPLYTTPPTSSSGTQQFSELALSRQDVNSPSPLRELSRHGSHTEDDEREEHGSKASDADEVLNRPTLPLVRKLFQQSDLKGYAAPYESDVKLPNIKIEDHERDINNPSARARNQNRQRQEKDSSSTVRTVKCFNRKPTSIEHDSRCQTESEVPGAGDKKCKTKMQVKREPQILQFPSIPMQLPTTHCHTLEPCKEYPNPLRQICSSLRKAINSDTVGKPGFIYCYECPTLLGHIKIGYVRLDEHEFREQLSSAMSKSPIRSCKATEKIDMPAKVALRLRAWAKKCGYTPHLVYWAPVVQAAWKMETLIHQQLKPYQRIESGCPGCQKGHKEWFQVDRKVARSAVDLWCRFAQTKPYESGILGDVWNSRTLDWMSRKPLTTSGGLPEFLNEMHKWVGNHQESVHQRT